MDDLDAALGLPPLLSLKWRGKGQSRKARLRNGLEILAGVAVLDPDYSGQRLMRGGGLSFSVASRSQNGYIGRLSTRGSPFELVIDYQRTCRMQVADWGEGCRRFLEAAAFMDEAAAEDASMTKIREGLHNRVGFTCRHPRGGSA